MYLRATYWIEFASFVSVFVSLTAPSRPPLILGQKLKSDGRVNVAWEDSEPLANEAPIDGYKVSTVLLLYRL